MKKRYLAFALAFALILSLAQVAAVATDEKGSYVDGYYRYNEPVVVTVNYAVHSPLEDANELWIFEWARRTMNIDFQVVENTPDTTSGTKIPLLFAAGDLPDCLMRFFEDSERMIKYGDYEQMLRPINDLITEELTPHLYKIFTEDRPEVWQFPWSTPEGNLYYFPAIQNNVEYNITCTHQPIWYNTAWFEAVGYSEPPATVDEFIDALRKIKEQDPGQVGENLVPLASYSYSGKYSPDQVFANALGFYSGHGNDFDAYMKNEDGSYRYVCMPYEDMYYEYVKIMRTLYSERLIDQDLYTNTLSAYNAMISNGYVAAFTDNESYLAASDPFAWDILPPLTSDFNDEQFVVGGSGSLGSAPTLRRSAMMIITADCEDLQAEAIARFMDTAYGYEGPDNEKRYIFWYGPQAGVDDTYGMTEGWYIDENNNRVVPEVNSGKYANDESFRFSVTTNVNNEYMDRRTDGTEFEDGNVYAKDTIQGYSQWQKRYSFNPYLKYSLLTLAYDEDTTVEISALKSTLETYANSEIAKFVVGQRELNEEQWDAYQSELEAYGVLDYIATAQEAFNSLYSNGVVK